MTDLLSRLQEANEGQQCQLFEYAVSYAHRQGWIDKETAQQAMAWIESGAFESAAMLLVTVGWGFSISDRAPDPHKGRAVVHNKELHFTGMAARQNPNRRAFEYTAATPALALCAACIKAMEAETPTDTQESETP